MRQLPEKGLMGSILESLKLRDIGRYVTDVRITEEKFKYDLLKKKSTDSFFKLKFSGCVKNKIKIPNVLVNTVYKSQCQ